MQFTPTTELFLNDAWTDVTADTFQGEGISITRGRADEAPIADPSSCALTLNNRSGTYSPRNPVGSLYGLIGRNTPVRVRMPTSEPNYLALPGAQVSPGGFGHWTSESYALTPDHSSLDITGDIDIRVDVEPISWRPGPDGYGLADKITVGPTVSRSWGFWLSSEGNLVFRWSPDGSATPVVTSTVAVPEATGRLAVRVTRAVASGTVSFYTAPTINGSWTLLGSTVATSAGVGIFSGSADVHVGQAEGGGSNSAQLQGKVYAFELRSGINGTVVASPDFTGKDSGETGFADAQDRVWVFRGSAVMVNPGARFHGEVTAWPVRWDKTGRDVRVPVQASGIMRRLGQGVTPFRSVMYRRLTAVSAAGVEADGVVAYWPCEDGSDAEEFASALPDAPPMRHPSGPTNNASYDQFKASDPLPTASLVQWTGHVPTYTTTGSTQVRFLLAVPTAGVPATADVCRLRAASLNTPGLNASRWDLTLGIGGSLRLQVFNSDDVSVYDSGFVATSLNGKRVLVSIEIDDVGPDITYLVRLNEVGGTSALASFSATMTNRRFGRVERIAMNTRGIMDTVALGHISVQNVITPFLTADRDALVAYKGELAPARVMRLCREEDIPVMITGDSSKGAALGPQLSGAFLELLREAADADLGVLYEPRGFIGLAYRTRGSLYAQEATLAVDYDDRTVFEIEPTEDDDSTRNDITVARISGGSARVTDETSALSVLEPPYGIGRYEEEVQISLFRDDELANQASWRLRLGTVDEARFPVIGFNLAASVFRGDAVLTAAAVALDVGDRLVIENPPTTVGPPEAIQQITQGFSEVFTGPEWLISTNCTPASPWDVGVWDDSAGPGEARYSSDGTTVLVDDGNAISILSAPASPSPVWGTSDLPYDIMIGGERITVGGVTGDSEIQIFTGLTRSVNGVVKTHTAGSPVELFKPAIYAL